MADDPMDIEKWPTASFTFPITTDKGHYPTRGDFEFPIADGDIFALFSTPDERCGQIINNGPPLLVNPEELLMPVGPISRMLEVIWKRLNATTLFIPQLLEQLKQFRVLIDEYYTGNWTGVLSRLKFWALELRQFIPNAHAFLRGVHLILQDETKKEKEANSVDLTASLALENWLSLIQPALVQLASFLDSASPQKNMTQLTYLGQTTRFMEWIVGQYVATRQGQRIPTSNVNHMWTCGRHRLTALRILYEEERSRDRLYCRGAGVTLELLFNTADVIDNILCACVAKKTLSRLREVTPDERLLWLKQFQPVNTIENTHQGIIWIGSTDYRGEQPEAVYEKSQVEGPERKAVDVPLLIPTQEQWAKNNPEFKMYPFVDAFVCMPTETQSLEKSHWATYLASAMDVRPRNLQLANSLYPYIGRAIAEDIIQSKLKMDNETMLNEIDQLTRYGPKPIVVSPLIDTRLFNTTSSHSSATVALSSAIPGDVRPSKVDPVAPVIRVPPATVADDYNSSFLVTEHLRAIAHRLQYNTTNFDKALQKFGGIASTPPISPEDMATRLYTFLLLARECVSVVDHHFNGSDAVLIAGHTWNGSNLAVRAVKDELNTRTHKMTTSNTVAQRFVDSVVDFEWKKRGNAVFDTLNFQTISSRTRSKNGTKKDESSELVINAFNSAIGTWEEFMQTDELNTEDRSLRLKRAQILFTDTVEIIALSLFALDCCRLALFTDTRLDNNIPKIEPLDFISAERNTLSGDRGTVVNGDLVSAADMINLIAGVPRGERNPHNTNWGKNFQFNQNDSVNKQLLVCIQALKHQLRFPNYTNAGLFALKLDSSIAALAYRIPKILENYISMAETAGSIHWGPRTFVRVAALPTIINDPGFNDLTTPLTRAAADEWRQNIMAYVFEIVVTGSVFKLSGSPEPKATLIGQLTLTLDRITRVFNTSLLSNQSQDISEWTRQGVLAHQSGTDLADMASGPNWSSALISYGIDASAGVANTDSLWFQSMLAPFTVSKLRAFDAANFGKITGSTIGAAIGASSNALLAQTTEVFIQNLATTIAAGFIGVRAAVAYCYYAKYIYNNELVTQINIELDQTKERTAVVDSLKEAEEVEKKLHTRDILASKVRSSASALVNLVAINLNKVALFTIISRSAATGAMVGIAVKGSMVTFAAITGVAVIAFTAYKYREKLGLDKWQFTSTLRNGLYKGVKIGGGLVVNGIIAVTIGALANPWVGAGVGIIGLLGYLFPAKSGQLIYDLLSKAIGPAGMSYASAVTALGYGAVALPFEAIGALWLLASAIGITQIASLYHTADARFGDTWWWPLVALPAAVATCVVMSVGYTLSVTIV